MTILSPEFTLTRKAAVTETLSIQISLRITESSKRAVYTGSEESTSKTGGHMRACSKTGSAVVRVK